MYANYRPSYQRAPFEDPDHGGLASANAGAMLWRYAMYGEGPDPQDVAVTLHAGAAAVRASQAQTVADASTPSATRAEPVENTRQAPTSSGVNVAIPDLAVLPGGAGVQVAGRLSPAQMEALTVAHGGIEFALIYRYGQGRNGGGGTYWLYSGTAGQVTTPIGADIMDIYHTHPGGTRIASGPDQRALAAAQALGSPQRSAGVVPVGHEPFRYTTTQVNTNAGDRR
jgi:hypothetical protein